MYVHTRLRGSTGAPLRATIFYLLLLIWVALLQDKRMASCLIGQPCANHSTSITSIPLDNLLEVLLPIRIHQIAVPDRRVLGIAAVIVSMGG